MTKYERKKMIERIILAGRPGCIKCGLDVSTGYEKVDDFMDLVETPRVNSLLPRSFKNCNLVHVNCARAIREEKEDNKIEDMIAILNKGPAFQICYNCKKDITDVVMEDISKIDIYKSGRGRFLIHVVCPVE